MIPVDQCSILVAANMPSSFGVAGKIWIFGWDLHAVLGVGRVIICRVGQTPASGLTTGGIMFADSLAWTFYTSYLLNTFQFGHLKHTRAVKETHLPKSTLFFSIIIMDPLKGPDETRDVMLFFCSVSVAGPWPDWTHVVLHNGYRMRRTDIPPAGRSGTYSNCEPPTEEEDNEQQWKYFVLQSLPVFNPPPPTLLPFMDRDKTIEGLLKCAFGWECSTSPCL